MTFQSSEIQDTLFLAHLMFRPYKFVIFSYLVILMTCSESWDHLLSCTSFLNKKKKSKNGSSEACFGNNNRRADTLPPHGIQEPACFFPRWN